MLSGSFNAGIFIGGMEGVEDEYAMFIRFHHGVPAFPIASTGAATAKIFDLDTAMQHQHPELRDELSYLSLMRDLLPGTSGPRPGTAP
jgi:SLOG cluster3 family